MRVIQVYGAKDGSKANVMMLSASGSATGNNDFLRLVNVLRKRSECECNWETSDGFFMQTIDNYCFNTKEE